MRKYVGYSGEATGDFYPDSKFRYVITDPIAGIVDARVRGVTTVLGDILDKPGLRLWARDEMAKMLFGFEFKDGRPIYNEKNGLLKTLTTYSAKLFQAVLDKSFDAYKVKSDAGKDIGTMTHDYIARYLEGGIPTLGSLVEEYPDMSADNKAIVVKAVNAFAKWWESLPNKELIGSENIIYSRKYQYAGTYDIKVKINGKLYMLDVKTTNRSFYAPLGIYPEYFMQLGGYANADNESTGDVYDDVGVVNVGKDGKVSVATALDLGLTVDDCVKSFVYGVRVHDWLDKTKKLTQDGKLTSSLMVDNEQLELLSERK